ncbi:hypothetical protein [Streptomyces sp. NPDC059409]|uniref:restriction endonuclease subunit S n=1 Tax=Streptomyces sp. NPDC059409 TaxID=3346824 RepID=UPI00369EEC25
MNLSLNKSAWKRVALGDVAKHVTDRVDAETSGLKRFLAGEHIPSNDLAITQWGVIGRDPIGPMFYKRFRPGHVLYVSRRSYLRKTAVPEFEGITGEKTFVLESRDESVLLQRFLPFVLSAEAFHSYAVANSRGSVNPYINWTELANYEFDLPSLDEQQRLAGLLWALETHRRALVSMTQALEDAVIAKRESELGNVPWELTLDDVLIAITAGKSLPGTSTPATAKTRGVLKVSAVSGQGFVAQENKELVEQSAFMPEHALANGDLLITRANTAAYVGRPAIVDSDYPNLMLSDKTLRLDVDEAIASTGFVYECLLSQRVRQRIADSATGTGAAMKNISQRDIRALPLPRIATEAQERLVAEVGSIRSAANTIRQEAETTFTLRGHLLATIFGGVE